MQYHHHPLQNVVFPVSKHQHRSIMIQQQRRLPRCYLILLVMGFAIHIGLLLLCCKSSLLVQQENDDVNIDWTPLINSQTSRTRQGINSKLQPKQFERILLRKMNHHHYHHHPRLVGLLNFTNLSLVSSVVPFDRWSTSMMPPPRRPEDKAHLAIQNFNTTRASTLTRNLQIQIIPTRSSRRKLFDEETCTMPMAKWHSNHFPTCNLLHDINILENEATLMGVGGRRVTYSISGHAVLRTILFHRAEFRQSEYEIQRTDAVISERLTSSPYVMNIFGYCGLSSLAELGDNKSTEWLEKLYFLEPIAKLRMAQQLTSALVDLHTTDDMDESTVVVRNLKPDNLLLVKGIIKMNDFDESILLRRNHTSQRACLFQLPQFLAREKPYQPPWKDGNLSVDVDLFSLGATIYAILNGENPYADLGSNHTAMVQQLEAGKLPRLRKEVMRRTDVATITMVHVFEQCFSQDPHRRPTAKQVLAALNEAAKQMRTKATLRIVASGLPES